MTRKEFLDRMKKAHIMKPMIYRVRVGASHHYFWDEVEARMMYEREANAGRYVALNPIPMPQTPKEFCTFLEQSEQLAEESETQ